jgi:hypothetical protein
MKMKGPRLSCLQSVRLLCMLSIEPCRNTARWTCSWVFFPTKAHAKTARQAYIDKTLDTKDVLHFQPGNKDIDLERNVMLTTQRLDGAPSDQPQPSPGILRPGEPLWLLACQSKVKDQVFRTRSCIFTSRQRMGIEQKNKPPQAEQMRFSSYDLLAMVFFLSLKISPRLRSGL